MKKEKIVQFVCFETPVTTDVFISQWELYNDMVKVKQKVILQQESENKCKYQFVSQHSYSPDETQFIFKKNRRSSHVLEVEMRVKEIGGYSPLQIECNRDSDDEESKILLFLNCFENELDDYRSLPDYTHLNIYQAYYESCTYTFILEYFVNDANTEQLFEMMKTKKLSGDIGVYKECLLQEK